MFSYITFPHLYHCTLFTPTFAPNQQGQGQVQSGDHQERLQQLEDRRRREAMAAAEEIALRERQRENDIRNPPECLHIQKVFLCGHSSIIHTPSCAGPSTIQCANSGDVSTKLEVGADCAACKDSQQTRQQQHLEAQEWEDWVDVEMDSCGEDLQREKDVQQRIGEKRVMAAKEARKWVLVMKAKT